MFNNGGGPHKRSQIKQVVPWSGVRPASTHIAPRLKNKLKYSPSMQLSGGVARCEGEGTPPLASGDLWAYCCGGVGVRPDCCCNNIGYYNNMK